MSYNKAKRSLAAFKGHYNSTHKAFRTLCAVQPCPTPERLDKSYKMFQERIESLLNCIDRNIALLDDDVKMTEEKVDVDVEYKQLLEYHEQFMNEQCECESLYVNLKGRSTPLRNNVPLDTASSSIVTPSSITDQSVTMSTRPTVRLTALDPPSWNGVKADFYTWKKKFVHIMEEARISSELTQLCYLQNQKTLPSEYQSFISDCSTINEVWSRLEERIPRETIKFEVISEFRKLKPLLVKPSSLMLRQFANEISLFCRRMSDLDFEKESYSCMVMQDIYERLNVEIAIRYRSKIELQKGLGQNVEEDIDSLCTFLRAEATTLELTNRDPVQSNLSRVTPKSMNALNERESTTGEFEKSRCPLGCGNAHRLIECDVYMKKNIEERRKFVKESYRCFICLGLHLARNCQKRKEKCKNCSEGVHHWTTCLNNAEGRGEMKSSEKESSKNENDKKEGNGGLNVTVKPFTPGGSNYLQDVSDVRCSKRDNPMMEFAPVVTVEVENWEGRWVKAKCLLDTGSNSTLIRSQFAVSNKLNGSNPCFVSFRVAGGGVHRERAEEFDFKIRSLSKNEPFLITATGVKKPCAGTSSISKEIFKKYEHLRRFEESICLSGGDIDILIGQDYAPLIVPETTIRDERDPDHNPSIAITRLGMYLYGSLMQTKTGIVKEILSINYLNKEDELMKTFFYSDRCTIGVRPTSLCACSDSEIAESAFIKHVRKTTTLDPSGRVRVNMPWKPGYPEKLPNNTINDGFE